MTGTSSQTVTVGYNTSNGTATAGSDYTNTSGTLTFAPGVTTQTITVPIANDTVFENSETFNVNLVTPTNATISDNLGVGTITDNDTAPALSVSSATVAESAGFAQFTVSLSAASGVATAVNLALGGGTATGGGNGLRKWYVDEYSNVNRWWVELGGWSVGDDCSRSDERIGTYTN